MTHVSKKNIENNLRIKAWSRLLKSAKESGSEEILIKNLGKFLTPTELIMLEKRLIIPVLLEQKLSYKTIGEMIDVSSTTISFVRHNLTRKPRVHRKYSSRLNHKPKKKLPLLPPRVGYGRWYKAKQYE